MGKEQTDGEDQLSHGPQKVKTSYEEKGEKDHHLPIGTEENHEHQSKLVSRPKFKSKT